MKYFKFIKEYDQRWFVVLPEWEGDKDDLEMVLGADTMLDIIAQGKDMVEIAMSTEPFNGHKYELHFNREDGGGAWYDLKSELFNFELWLCYVTKFVFNNIPKTIYIR